MPSVAVLIVENDQVQSANLESQLKKLDYTVLAAVPTGEEALELVKEKTPDVVIMDIDLDGQLDGIETANKIFAEYGIPIIYLSQFEDLRTYRSARRNIRAEYVAKPLSVVNILNAIENLLFKEPAADQSPSKINDRIFVKNGLGHYAVYVRDIIYIEANREVSVIHHTTSDKPSTVSVNLGSLENKLTSFGFLARCSRYHMINLQKVTRIKDKWVENPATGKESQKKVVELGEHTIVLSDKYKSQIISRFHMH